MYKVSLALAVAVFTFFYISRVVLSNYQSIKTTGLGANSFKEYMQSNGNPFLLAYDLGL